MVEVSNTHKQQNTLHKIPRSPLSCFVEHPQNWDWWKISLRFLKNQTWMQTKGQAAVIRSAPFYLPGLHCRGSFEMLAVIPASNEWCRIGSCCLSMFELWLSKSCFTKVSAPVDSPFRVGVWRGGCSKIPFIKRGSLPPTTWWEMQQ